MQIPFYKYHGTGNDFILIDQRSTTYLTRQDTTTIQQMCTRHFGIGADGLILLQNHTEVDFEMIYFNADGNESSMCGNGGRCIVAFAHRLDMFKKKCQFIAIDGLHEAEVEGEWVELKMSEVQQIEQHDTHYFLNTGSPHYVEFVEDVASVDVFNRGKVIRYSDPFQPNGTNVNFVQQNENEIIVATYERGVENETFSCGTGVTAAAIAQYLRDASSQEIAVLTKGGKLKVRFQKNENGFSDIWLGGATKKVFEGMYIITKPSTPIG